MARPALYSKELADKVCSRIAEGLSMRSVCEPDDMPATSTLFKWIREIPEFSQQYACATEERTEAMSEDILDISDKSSGDWETRKFGGTEIQVVNNEAVQRSKLRVDTRKWLMSKMKPKKYGDKIDMTTNGKDIPVPIYGGNSKEV